jgi:hypothetical protein
MTRPARPLDVRLRAYALANMKDAVKRLQDCDMLGERASNFNLVAKEARWRHNHLDAAHKWATIAEALRPDPASVGVEP